ncbi:PREDICTED: uncharacterized protein LOC109179769 [Ipomoea nil]|uniref:uncharacterized protein LOC109179769 n=1 Tax=Ipomoea nil TaxID=35883 RepID=UPI000900B4A8|nr:PREDICTED: uncharacterized protein LOC109179769 [Ipomoea nil]
MVRTRNQRQGKIPRKGTAQQFAGTGIPSNPVRIEEEEASTVIMDPVPISQVPFEEIQEIRNPSPGNLTIDLHGDFTISSPTMDESRDNVHCTHEEEENPNIEPTPPHHPLSDREQRRRKRSDPYEGADPRAKRPNDFPVSARPPRGTPNIPPPRKDNTKKQKGKNTEEEDEWIPDDTELVTKPTEGKRRKLTAKEKGKQKIIGCADLSKLPKPYCPKFLTRENAKGWNKFVEKSIINQKLLELEKLENHEQISDALAKNQLLGSVMNIYPYEEHAIKEFYSNLTKATTNPTDSMFGKIYLRGKFYVFSPEIINEYLGTPSGDQNIQLESEQVASELTAGNVSFDKNKIKVAP